MGYQMVRITQEATYNVFNTSATSGQKADIFLTSGDACTVQKTPQYVPLRDSGVGNRMIKRFPGRYTVGGGLKTPLFPSQALLLTSLAANLTGSAPCYDLPSFTLDRLFFLDDSCATVYQRTTGCKIDQFTLSADMSDGGFFLMADMQIMGSKYDDTITNTDFPTQSLSAYPLDDPYLFYNLAGNLTIDTVRTKFQSFTLSIDNILKSFPDETLYVGSVGWKGRDVTWSTKLLYQTQTDRRAWNTGGLHTVSATFNNGTHSVAFNLEASNSYTSVGDSMPLDDYYTQTLSGQSLMDQASGTDLAITVT